MNFGQAAQQLSARLGLSGATAGTRQGDQCRTHIIEAIRRLADIPFEWNTAIFSTAITGGTNDYAMPATTRVPVELYYYTTNEYHRLERISIADMLRREMTTSTDVAKYWLRRGALIHVYPVPAAAWTLKGVYILDLSIADPTWSGTAATFPSDAGTSAWLESDKGLRVTICMAAQAYCAGELNRPDRAESYQAELNDHLATALEFTEATIQSEKISPCL